MTEDRNNLAFLLDQAMRGDLDALTPAEISALETALNESPDLAARMAEAVPPADDLAVPVASPSEKEWNAVWTKIEAASHRDARHQISNGNAQATLRIRSEPNIHGGAPPRILRLWTAVPIAAAACLALFFAWNGALGTRPGRPEIWTMTAAANTEILDLEVYDDAVVAVDFGDSDGAVVISVFEKSRASEGA